MPDTTDPIDALAKGLERVTRRQATTEQLVTKVAEAVADLAERLSRRDPEQVVFSWLLATDPEASIEAIGDLITWLDAVYVQYPDAFLPTCWLWHPPVVEELLWLRAAHAAAYQGKKPSPLAAGEWHERQRPGVVKRLKTSFGDCELARHAEGGDRTRLPLPAPLAGAAARVVQEWVADPTDRALPTPSDRQQEEAADWESIAARRR